MNRRKFLGTTGPALLASSLFGPTFGGAEAYPSRPIRIVVPGSAGGVLDVVARRLTDPIGKRLGQQVVIENKPGANGIIWRGARGEVQARRLYRPHGQFNVDLDHSLAVRAASL
jgi:tripartite-type tricarboxylate transporter receptor subunit TctC